MIDFFDKYEYSEADITALIHGKAEESIHLDFKAAESLGDSNPKKNEIAKDVSAFANSDGGIIIYGISEQDHRAGELSFVDGSAYTKEWLEQVVSSRIQRRIDGLRVFPVRFGGEIARSVYVVKIPRSALAPHMTSENRYYKRQNFESVRMEEYEVRDMYSRKQLTHLNIESILWEKVSAGFSASMLTRADYLLRFQVGNVGFAIGELYKLEIHMANSLTITDYPNELANYKVRTENQIAVFSIPNSSPIFQGETTTVVSGRISVSGENRHLLDDPGIMIKLFYTNGTKERVFKMLDVLEHQGTVLSKWAWR